MQFGHSWSSVVILLVHTPKLDLIKKSLKKKKENIILRVSQFEGPPSCIEVSYLIRSYA